MTKRCFIYIRVSTREQAEEGYSIGEQQERLIKYAEAMGWTIVKIYIDPGHSGATLERPGLEEMIDHIQEADVVLVDKLDRLSRSLFDTLFLIKKVFTPAGVAFVSKNEAFDTSSSFGMAMVSILAVFAELERERIKERMADGRAGRAKEGKWHGTVPIGYDYDATTGYLTINEYEAMQLREAAELTIQRVPIRDIIRLFDVKGYRTKYGPWWAETLGKALRRRVYLGEVYYKGEYYESQHPAIFDQETFDAVQAVLQERDRENERFKPGRRYTSPLGGMIWCKQCGAKYHWRRNGARKDGTPIGYYICYSRSKSDSKMVKDPNCKNITCRDFRLEEIIYDEIRLLKDDPAYIDKVRNSVDNEDKVAVIAARIKDLSGQISRFMDLYGLGQIPITEISAKVEPLAAEKRALEGELRALQEAVVPVVSEERIHGLVATFNEIVATGDTHAIHGAVGELIDYIEIDGENVHIHWNF